MAFWQTFAWHMQRRDLSKGLAVEDTDVWDQLYRMAMAPLVVPMLLIMLPFMDWSD